MEDELFPYSRVVDPEEVKQTPCFTTLSPRINCYDHLADEACWRFSKEWAEIMDPNETQQEIKNMNAAKMKKLLSQSILECIKIDPEIGMEIVDSYRKNWLKKMDVPDTNSFQNLDEFINFRYLNAGAEEYWMMVGYSHGKKLTKEEDELVANVLRVATKTMVCTNDYYSWEKEHRASNDQDIGRIVNVVAFFMRTGGLSIEASREKTRNCILAFEQDYLRERTLLYQAHPSLPLHVRKLVELCGSAIAGVHYWSAIAPRYNSWEETDKRNGEAIPVLEKQIQIITPLEQSRHVSSKQHAIANTTNRHSTEAEESVHLPATTTLTKNDATPKEVNSVPKTSKIESKREWEQEIITNGDAFHLNLSALLAPCDYIKSLPSKGFRSSLVDALNVWLQVPQKKLIVIKNVIEMLHNSSLILDDIEDDSNLRRGKTATHKIFGTAQAINSANFLFVAALQAIKALKNESVVTVVLDELKNLFMGQSWDLYWKFHLKPPTEREYLAMIDAKTGAMFSMLVSLMQAVSPVISRYNFDHLTRLVGRFFQVRDDYMNLQGKEYSKQKGFCEDFEEGKLSYPIVHCLENNPNFHHLIMGMFRQRQGKPMIMESKLQILDCLEKTGALDATRKLVQKLEVEAEEQIDVLETQMGESNPLLRLMLKALSIVPRKEVNGIAA
ncbi:hypothetical protein MMC22_010819 [Lobaria immixta]|nr:hypothetical protein [Lobaria immixta]